MPLAHRHLSPSPHVQPTAITGDEIYLYSYYTALENYHGDRLASKDRRRGEAQIVEGGTGGRGTCQAGG